MKTARKQGGHGRKRDDSRFASEPVSAELARIAEESVRRLQAEQQHGPVRVIVKDGIDSRHA